MRKRQLVGDLKDAFASAMEQVRSKRPLPNGDDVVFGAIEAELHNTGDVELRFTVKDGHATLTCNDILYKFDDPSLKSKAD